MDSHEILENSENLKELDRGGMLEAVAGMPDMIPDAVQRAQSVSLPKMRKVRQLVVSGMGGSAIAGDVLLDLLSDRAELPLYVNRDYQVPAFVGEGTLFFALSYSGDTEETLSALKAAAKRKAKIICLTSGGKLREIAESNKYPLYLIPAGYQPRAALAYLLVPLLLSLERLGLISGIKENLEESIALLQRLKNAYGMDASLRANPAKQLAKKLCGRLPLVFATGETRAAGLRLKTQFNENSKVTALFNLFPELNHNEIVNLSTLKREEHQFSLILLRDEGDSERNKKRMDITKSLIGNQLGGVNEVSSQGKSHLARLLSLIYFGDFVSVYLAVLRGVDPSQVDVISRLKKELLR